MFNFLLQNHLKNRGFSSGKKRHKINKHEWNEFLKSSIQIKFIIFFVFTLLICAWTDIFNLEYAKIFESKLQPIALIITVSSLMFFHWSFSFSNTFSKNSIISLILILILSQLFLLDLNIYINSILKLNENILFLTVPYIFVPIIVSLLINHKHAFFSVIYINLFAYIKYSDLNSLYFLYFYTICAFIAIFFTKKLQKRKKLLFTGFSVGLSCFLLACIFGIIKFPSSFYNDLSEWKSFSKDAFLTILSSILTTFIIGGLIPILEYIFKITTNLSWLELSDLNHPLLKKMTIEAPGTYHHSLIVASLSERAAEEIGANSIMCRTCSYFHDIGKIEKPNYFIENIDDSNNPNDSLTPTMSALIIISHIKDGVSLAIKHGLNQEIINIIREHHGTSLIKFFYHRAIKQRENILSQDEGVRPHEEDVPEVKESSFRYNGPPPRTKESAIISLADSVESASRTLSKITPKKLEELIDNIFLDRIQDGQLNEVNLTLKDLAKIKKSFSKTLLGMMHSRVNYPIINKINNISKYN